MLKGFTGGSICYFAHDMEWYKGQLSIIVCTGLCTLIAALYLMVMMSLDVTSKLFFKWFYMKQNSCKQQSFFSSLSPMRGFTFSTKVGFEVKKWNWAYTRKWWKTACIISMNSGHEFSFKLACLYANNSKYDEISRYNAVEPLYQFLK